MSKLERRADMYVSTLRRYIEAMGGSLEIRACFADGAVRINQFHELDALTDGMVDRNHRSDDASDLYDGASNEPRDDVRELTR